MLTRPHHRGSRPSGHYQYTLYSFAVSLFLVFLTGCSLLRPRETVRTVHDTTTVHHRDSIHFRDSIYIREWMKGDTVYVDRFRDRYLYRDRWRDSIRVKVDSVAVERTKEVKVERPLNAWQRFRIGAFWWLLALAAVGWRKQILRLIKKAAGLFG